MSKPSINLPSGWGMRQLGEFASLKKGITYASTQYCGPDQGAAFLTIKSVKKNGGYKREGLKFYSGPISEHQALLPGDLLIANTDLTRAGDIVGCPVVVPDLRRATTMSMDLSKMVVHASKVDSKFLAQALMLDEVRTFMRDNASGSTVLHLKTSAVPKLWMPIPDSIDEQRGIAAVLSALDEQIELTEALVAKLRLQKQGLMRDLLIGKVRIN